MLNKKILRAIKGEVEAYIAMNGEQGAWGEPMRDCIGVDCVMENLQSGHNIEESEEIRKEIENQLIV